MTRLHILLLTTTMATAACAGPQVEYRTVKSPIPVKAPAEEYIALGHGQLAIGNVALALESFRKAHRFDPQNIDALEGLGIGYDRMGRHDLSKRYYETGLAVAPDNRQLLARYAAALDANGERVAATRVREEIEQRTQAAALAAVDPVDLPAQPEVETLEVGLAEAIVAASGTEVPIEPLPAPQVERSDPRVVRLARSEPAPAPDAEPDDEPDATPVESAPAEPIEIRTAEMPKPRLIIKAPPAPSLAPPPPAPEMVAQLHSLAEVESIAERTAGTSVSPEGAQGANDTSPRLVRLSMGEIALVTKPGPIWKEPAAPRPMLKLARADAITGLTAAERRGARIELLNAARYHRLAARTRAGLREHGWHGMSVGDAPKVRAKSVILYPIGSRLEAERLAEDLGFSVRMAPTATKIVVILGRDSVKRLKTTRNA